MASAHHGHGRGDGHARGARARARRAALGGGGRHALQRHGSHQYSSACGDPIAACKINTKRDQQESSYSVKACPARMLRHGVSAPWSCSW